MKDSQIDYSDIPPINFEELGEGQLQLPIAKSPLSIRIDQDVVAFFKKGGRGLAERATGTQLPAYPNPVTGCRDTSGYNGRGA